MIQTRLDLYERVTPLAGIGIFERNLQTGEIYWNATIRSILDVDQDFFPAFEESLKFYNHPEHVEGLINKAMLSGKPESATLQLTSANGIEKWVSLHLQGDCEGGRCIRVYGTLKDVTAQKKMTALLQEREKQFSLAFDHAPIGMALVSPTGRWIKVNTSLCQMIGYSEPDLQQKTFQEITHPEDLKADLAFLNQLLNGSIDSYSMNKRYFHYNGHIIWGALNVSLIRDEEGKPLYFVSQIQDITDQIKSQETIKNQNSRLLSFAHIVSHNLRSHTGNMKMLTDMILQGDEEEDRDSLIRMLNQSSQSLLETLENLNEIVEVHSASEVERVSLNLLEAVQRVVNILSPSIKRTDTHITIDIPADLSVGFNPSYLESIIMNLVTNSMKYKNPGRLAEITISAERQGDSTHLHVKDNGQGIDLNLHGKNLFGMYQTFHQHPDARGMGLFLVKTQIETFGGQITVKSEPGSGTVFTLRFE